MLPHPLALRAAPRPHLLRAGTAKAETVTSKGGVWCVLSPPAAEVGLATIKAGGNAVDAAGCDRVRAGGDMARGREHRRRRVHDMVDAPGQAPHLLRVRESAKAAAKSRLLADGKVTSLTTKAAGVPEPFATRSRAQEARQARMEGRR